MIVPLELADGAESWCERRLVCPPPSTRPLGRLVESHGIRPSHGCDLRRSNAVLQSVSAPGPGPITMNTARGGYPVTPRVRARARERKNAGVRAWADQAPRPQRSRAGGCGRAEPAGLGGHEEPGNRVKRRAVVVARGRVWSGGCRLGVPSATGQLCIDSLPSEGRLDRGDVDLVHGHHRVEGAFGRCGVRAGGGVE